MFYLKIYIKAILLILVAFLAQLYRNLPKKAVKYIEAHSCLKTFFNFCTIVFIIFGCLESYKSYVNREKYSVFAAPPTATVYRGSIKKLNLKIVNNNDYPLFEPQLKVSIKEGDIEIHKVNITPLDISNYGDGTTPLIFFISYKDENGSINRIYMFDDVNAHSTKEFAVAIDCRDCKEKSIVAFEIVGWSSNPLQFTIPLKKEFNGFPKKFDDLLKNETVEN